MISLVKFCILMGIIVNVLDYIFSNKVIMSHPVTMVFIQWFLGMAAIIVPAMVLLLIQSVCYMSDPENKGDQING